MAQSQPTSLVTSSTMASKPKQGKILKLCKKGKYEALLKATTQEELRRGFEPDLTQPIHYFAARGNLEAVRELVETYKCNPECQNVHGITPLHCASYCGRLSVVKSLVEEHKCDANVRDKEGACPLACASYCVMGDVTFKSPLDVFQKHNKPRSEHTETAKFLLSVTTLQIASLANDLCILRLPVYCGFFDDFKELVSTLNLELGDNSPELSAGVAKCLEIALSSEESKSEFVQSLLCTYTKYIKIAMEESDAEQSQLTPNLFHKACSKADINVIKIFVELGICKPDVQSVKIAIDRKDYELVQFLLQSADHPLLLDRYYTDFYMWFSLLSYIFHELMNDQKLIKLVFDSTLGKDIRDSEGNTPLHLVCKHSGDSLPGIITERYSCYQFVLNNNNELPVHVACEGENLELIKAVSSQLQEKDINTQDIHGNTPLHVICECHLSTCYPFNFYYAYREHLKYFIIEKKCDLNILNNLGELPVHTLLKSENILYRYYFDSDSQDSDQINNDRINSDQSDSDQIDSDQSDSDQSDSDQGDRDPVSDSDQLDNDQIDRTQTVIELITSGQCFKINAQDSDGNTPLHLACKNEESSTVLYLVSKFECDLNMPNNEGCIPLHYAISFNLTLKAIKAVSNGCTMKCKQNNVKKTPLHIACENMQYLNNVKRKILVDLVWDKECICVQDNEGNTPLHIACQRRNVVTAIYLIQKYHTGFTDNSNEVSLEAANTIHSGCTMKCKQNNTGQTPLHIVCTNMQFLRKDKRMFLLNLISDEAIINVQDNDGNTPLHIACKQHDFETTLYLTSHYQCDFNLVNDDHCLALHYAVSSHIDFVKVVSESTMLHMLNSKGMTPLHIACENENLHVVKYLVFEKNCFPSCYEASSDIYDSLKIHLACKDESDIDLLKALANECNVNNNKSHKKKTPLHVACKNNNILAVKALLELKCNILCKDSQGRVPFHIACSKSLECVKEMVPYITNDVVNTCDNNGNTPLHIALKKNQLDIVNFLLSNFQCNFSIKNSEGEFPTHLVCSTNLSVVRIIMEKSTAQSISINCQTQQDNTPLHIACQFGELDIVKYLTDSFDCEPSMRLRNKEGKLPVDYACEHSLEMVKLVSRSCTVEDLVSQVQEYLHQPNWFGIPLLSFPGVSHIYKQKQKLSTLNFACKLGCLDIVMYLIKEKGCTLSALNNNQSALAYACGLQVCPYDSKDTPHPHNIISIVRFLIHECGYNPGKTVSGTSLFQYSCQINSLQLMKAIPINQLSYQDSEGNTLLHYACKYGRVDIVQYLLYCGCNQNKVNNEGDSPLHIACRSSLDVTKLLTNCDINLKNADGYTSLHIACESKKKDIALYLIEEMNCDVKVRNNEGEYPLHIASLNSMQVRKLVDKSDINCQDDYGDTPLHNACYLRDSDMIQFLLSYQECKADILNDDENLALHIFLDSITISQSSYQSPQKFSLKKVHYYRKHVSNLAQMVDLILKRSSAAVLTTNHDGKTPNDMAIMNGELEVIEVLLSVGEVDEVTRQRLLHTACVHRKPEIVHWLIAQGASTEVADDDEDYPQHICLKSDYDCLETLTKLGPLDACQQDKNNDTILHLACRKGFEVNILLKYIIQTHHNCKKAFSMQNVNSYTPLHVLAACLYTVSPDVLILIECDNPNLQDKSGNTPLHLACQHENYKLAEHLITNCKCDPNVTNDNGELPLHIAVAQSQMEITELLASTENVNKCTNSGDSPLHIACKSLRVNLKATNMLLGLHSITSIPNNQGNTPLHVAVTKSLEVVKLVATSDNTNVQNHNGDTPLHIACCGENMDIVIFLLEELKCSVEILNKDFESAFHILFNNWHYHACSSELQISLLYYIPQQLKDKSSKTGESILHIACRKADHKVVMYLVETLKCKVDAVNKHSGATALHFACKRDSLIVVQLVTGCNPTAQIKDVSYLPKETELVCGDTPLHVACRESNLDVIRHLLRSGHSQALNYFNDLKELPIHLAVAACESYPLIQVFISQKSNFDCNATDIRGDTPLHIMCRHNPSIACVKRMLHKLKCKVDVQNNEGNYPLHVLCQNKLICKGVAKVLSIGLSDDQIKHRNKKGNTALHEFLRFSHDTTNSSHHFKSLLQIFIDRGLLLFESDDEPVLDCLKLACHYQKLDVVKYLLEKYTSLLQKIPITLLHKACLNCNGGVLEYMLITFEHAFDINIPNTNGDLPLHLAARLKVCKESTLTLLAKHTKDINHKNNQGETPLHALYSGNKTHASLRYYLSVFLEDEAIDLSATSNNGFTPLHYICRAQKYDDLKTILRTEKEIDANIQDENGATLLHFACQSNDLDVVKLLLKLPNTDPSIEDYNNQAPITLTTDSRIIKLLIERGADPQPLSVMHKEFFERFSCENPPPTPVKLLVIGYPSVGKTTLIKSLQNELSEEVLSEHFDHTAGIVTTDFNSQHYGVVTFYDFAGQAEYYASHDAVLHSTIKNVPPIVLILVNLNGTTKSILNQTNYWIGVMAYRCSGLGCEAAHMILVGSHADVLESQGKNPSEKVSKLHQSVAAQVKKKNIILKDTVYLNCTKSQSNQMSKLHQLLQQSTSELREKGVMDFNSHCFYVFLLHISRKSNFVHLGRILSALKSKSKDVKNSPLFALPFDRPKVIEMCHDLNEKGHIMFIEHPTIIDMSWLILDKSPLLHEILGTLFSPSNFPQHRPLSYSTGVVPLSYSTGVVPLSRFHKHFSTKHSYPSTLSLAFLSTMEYCREIKDPVVLNCIVKEKDFSKSERYYFFPNLVSIERPTVTEIWENTDSNAYKSGWIIQCNKDGECFSPHFIQALLLRLAFSFTTGKDEYSTKEEEYGTKDFQTYDDSSESEEDESRIKKDVIKSKCSVWKNGIYWKEASGVETVVEIQYQNTLVLLMQCLIAGCEIELVERRSSIISKVLSAKDEYCSTADLREFFLHPKAVVYPLTFVKGTRKHLFSFHQVMKSITQKKPLVINDQNEHVSLEDLLYYEHFSELSKVVKRVKGKNVSNKEELSIFCGRKPPDQGISNF